MKDEHVDKSLVLQLDSAFIRKDPYGVVLIISPWNYPIHLFLVPLIGAIAAGNCVIIKPSEIAKNTERLIAEVLSCYLDNDCFAVVTGGVQETTRLLENKFDYIFFTGSPSVGKVVMMAAARHLTPVTLELGGKNPCYVSDCCDVQNVARRVAWGRFFNAGQTCVAPDYVLCSLETQERLMPALRQAITEFFGSNPRDSPDLGRMVGEEQFRRVRALLGSGRLAIGGHTDERELYIAPTVLADVLPTEPAMQQEIFGPVLPIVVVGSMDEAIDFINSRERPLVIYAFSSDSKVVNQVLERTSSGSFCGNDTLMHVTLTSLPFGGIGRSRPHNLPLASGVGSCPWGLSHAESGSWGDVAPCVSPCSPISAALLWSSTRFLPLPVCCPKLNVLRVCATKRLGKLHHLVVSLAFLSSTGTLRGFCARAGTCPAQADPGAPHMLLSLVYSVVMYLWVSELPPANSLSIPQECGLIPSFRTK
ncbi:aldehyde dehydrogenase family 3 member B2-like isoform X2 [Colius striatus]|nr:aldehyde dehydrogenase family 3 member B2-like isoform X2 [Colius striatus]